MRKKDYSKGETVEVKINRILPHFGILVSLDDGTRGYVRRRELSWDEKVPDPKKFGQPGSQLKAVVLDRDKETGNLSLSIRLQQRDPWQNIDRRYSIGKEIEGIVTRILPYSGAFIEIEKGVDGFIAISHIHPEKEIKSVDDVLATEDHICATVIMVDSVERHIQLSIKAYIDGKRQKKRILPESTGTGTPIENIIDQATKDLLFESIQKKNLSQKRLLKPGRLRQILIIDDSPDFGRPLTQWIRRQGYDAELVATGKEGITTAVSKNFDLVFLDAHLPDMNGIEIAEAISTRHPQIPILFVTGYDYDLDIERANKMGMPVLFKPLREDDLIEFLTILEQKGHLPVISRSSQEEIPYLRQQKKELPAKRNSFPQTLHTVLKTLSKETGAKQLAVFCVDLNKEEVTLDTGVGVPALSEEERHNLVYSPIHDVAEGKEILNESRISQRRYRYLLNWLSFNSCIGIPVPALYEETVYTLFLFHQSLGYFQKHDLARAQTAASLLGATLAFEQSEKQLYKAQQWILKGQLAEGTLHEVNNRLGGALLTMKLLQDDYQNFKKEPDKHFPAIYEHIERLEDNLESISESVGLFRRLSRGETLEKIDVNHLLHRIVDLMKPLADKKKVTIEMKLDDNLPAIKSVETWLNHTFCNVILNAIEWMTYLPEARLTINTQFQPENEKAPIYVYFKDVGPGIHHYLFNKIFDLGFTTKKGGTGQGLFIARGLMESIGGAISVENSVIFLGSTFLIQLPIAFSEDV